MATSKVKGTSRKIKELKGIKPEKITDDQLKKHELMHRVATSRDELTLLQAEFENEYGTFDINIQDGTINYPKENGETDKKD